MSSSTSSRSTLTITPSTMSPSLKYLMVWSIAARKSSAVPMSFTAIWGVLSGRTWVEVMWSSAPDGGCVGTGRPRSRRTAGSFHGRHRGEAPVAGDHTTDLWRDLPWYGRPEAGSTRGPVGPGRDPGLRRVTIGGAWAGPPPPPPPPPSPPPRAALPRPGGGPPLPPGRPRPRGPTPPRGG